MNERIERAKTYIAIAESGDAKREAYKAAAEEIAAELQQRTSQRAVGRAIGKDESFVRAIVRWRDSGYEAKTPWLSDTRATTRAATSHAKQVLHNAPIETVEKIVADLPAERRRQVQQALHDTHPAITKKPPIGIMDSIKRAEENTGFLFLMGGALAKLSEAARVTREDWDRYVENASDEQKEIVQEEIRDHIATLLSINSDPQELLR